MIERRAEVSSSYARLRLFLETEDLASRRLTAEWLAGRLGEVWRSTREA